MMTSSSAEVDAILDCLKRESDARVDALERRYMPQPLSWWLKLAIAGFLLISATVGGTFGWMLATIALQPGACH